MPSVELDTSRVRHLGGVVGQRAVGIGATVFGDLNDGVVVFLRNARDDVVESPGPDLPTVVGDRPYVRHHVVVLDVGHPGRGGDEVAVVVVDADPVQRSLHDLAVTRLDAHDFVWR